MLRNKFPRALAVASMLTFTRCQTAPQPKPQRDAGTDLQAINALRSQFAAAYNSRNAAAAAAYFPDDAVLMLPNQHALEGNLLSRAS